MSAHRILSFICVLCFPGSLLAATSYSVTDITSDGNSTFSGVRSLNNRGEVVGKDASGNALLWRNNAIQNLGMLPGCRIVSEANWWAPGIYINDSGQVAGSAYDDLNSVSIGFLYDPVAGISDIGSLNPSAPSYTDVRGIDNSGTVVGSSWSPTALRGFIYDGNSMTDLGALPETGPGYSVATGVNSNGKVVGYSMPGGLVYWWSLGFAWEEGNMSNLGLPTPSTYYVWPSALNDANDIVGTYRDERGGNMCFLNSGGEFTDLSVYWPTDINNACQIVGFNGLWENGQLYDLNAQIPANTNITLGAALSINDSGQVLCEGARYGATRYLLLTPIPEPSTIVLLATSVASLAIMAWRRRKRS